MLDDGFLLVNLVLNLLLLLGLAAVILCHISSRAHHVALEVIQLLLELVERLLLILKLLQLPLEFLPNLVPVFDGLLKLGNPSVGNFAGRYVGTILASCSREGNRSEVGNRLFGLVVVPKTRHPLHPGRLFRTPAQRLSSGLCAAHTKVQGGLPVVRRRSGSLRLEFCLRTLTGFFWEDFKEVASRLNIVNLDE